MSHPSRERHPWALGVALLWAICAGFAVGIFIRSLVAPPALFVFALASLAAFVICFGALQSKRFKYGLVVGACLLSCGAGVFRMQSAIPDRIPELYADIGERITLQGVLVDAPDERSTQVRVPIRISSSGYTTDVLAIFPAHTELFYGEQVRVSGILDSPKRFDAGAGREFNYPGYLAAQGVSYELDRATLEEAGGFEGNPIVAAAYRVREMFVLGLERSLPEPHAGLAAGITVGEKRAMGKELTHEFQVVSLIHIVVLSGYNITVVISALFKMLKRAPRYVRFGAGGFVALFFAVMTGFASASLRAALMALIAISGSLSGRIYRPDRALILVCTLMLLWNPYLLVFDPGFQLSFLACAGLIVFSPLFGSWFARLPETFGLKDILVSTSSAQIAVLPLLLYQSGSLSLVSLPANLLALAAVPPAMLFSAIAALGGILLEPLSPFIGFPAYALLSYVLSIAHTLTGIPYAAVTVPAFSAWLMIPVYAVLFGLGMRYSPKEKTASAM